MTRQLFLIFALAAASLQAEPTNWKIDTSHSAAQFSVKHMMVSTVRGHFGTMTGTVVYDAANPAATKIDATVDVTTIDTRNEKRDAHLKSADFFDVATYPTITFKSKKVTPKADGSFAVLGDLTMRGVTQEVTLECEALRPVIKDQRGASRTGTTATTKINRQDFGVKWSRALDGGGVVVGDEVTITIDIELILPVAQ